MSWFSWNEPYYRSPRREPTEVVTDTLMLELSWQMKEAERLQRERDNEYRRLKSGVDYSWLVSTPRSSFDISQGERLGLEDLCSKVPASYCGSVIQRFRQVLMENEPELQEVSGLFRSVLLETLERVHEEQEAQRLTHQWNNRCSISLSLMSFKSRVRINPFGSTLGLKSNSYELGQQPSTWSLW
uniref:Protein RD3-like n=1 Tax=Sinocyclocheilus anshuiensis TaxID=1608454 RepID=A0A671MVY6_9TELE